MQITAKCFNELTSRELYEILKARMEIFVLEQKCIYQDMDDIDFQAEHIFIADENGRVQAYTRAFRYSRNNEPNTVRIGRFLTIEHGKGLGGKLLREAIEIIKEKMDPNIIYVEAQCHAIGFYEREGFKVCTEEFLDVGIPHKGMELILK